MRITFVLPHAGLSGGIRVVAIYAERLRQRGHTVVAVSTPVPQMSFRERLGSFLHGRGWPALRENGPSHFDGLPVEHRRIDRYRPIQDADVPDADVVVATWWETAEWVAAMSPSKGAKAFFIQHDETLFHPPELPQYRRRVEDSWRLPMKKITISQWLVDLCRERAGEDAVLIPNSVDTEQFTAPPRGKQPVPTVGLLYSAVPFKGCDVSLAAIDMVRAELTNLKLRAFGFEAPTPALPLPPGTDYTRSPAQDRIRDIYASCDVWLCGSRSEGFHLPPLEAMACGCPVVGTAVGGVVETVRQGVNGHVVPVGDSAALADRLLRVLRLPDDQWRAMSAAAFERARSYSWDDATDLMEAALEETVRSGSPAAAAAIGGAR